jgi:hypothetical protein
MDARIKPGHDSIITAPPRNENGAPKGPADKLYLVS